VLFAAIALVGALFWIFTGDINPSADDAQVDGRAIAIFPRVSGYVLKMLINDDTVVEKGDLMIQLDPADYQAQVDQAQAELQVVEACAASLKINVPFTEGTTTSATLAVTARVERTVRSWPAPPHTTSACPLPSRVSRKPTMPHARHNSKRQMLAFKGSEPWRTILGFTCFGVGAGEIMASV
jgi:membrane fusion protein (multidrug efflux system)